MGKEYINIKNAIDETLFNLMETFDNKIPLDLLGKIIKMFCIPNKNLLF